MADLFSSRKRSILTSVVGASGALVLLSACSTGAANGALPSRPGVTNHTGSIIDLWNYAWIAALAIGGITWLLTLWAVVVYRKRKHDHKLPLQTRANVPLELMYTVVPLIMVMVLFKWTAQTMTEITDTSAEPDVRIQVIGKQWSWDFNYLDDNVHFTGIQAELTGEDGVEATLPTLYLPVDERVEFILDSRDVIHSFWIPAFLYKLDMVPGRTNVFQVIPQQEGVYQGKCAELCGEYHSAMLFNVAVVSRAEYDQQMQALADAGNTGIVGLDYSRLQEAGISVPEEVKENQ